MKTAFGNGGWRLAGAVLAIGLVASGAGSAWAASSAELDRDSRAELQKLLDVNLVARKLRPDAAGILVFPSIVKAGFMFGGQIGEGVMLQNGRTTGYYNSLAASYGLQAGLQTFGYALFFMDKKSIDVLEDTAGFEIGVGPSVVLVDEGMGKTLTSTTVREGIYAFVFDQKGAMAGLGIQGSKITRIEK